MRVIYRKIRHARYLYIKRNVKKVWGARYLSKNTVFNFLLLIQCMLAVISLLLFDTYLLLILVFVSLFIFFEVHENI